MNGVIGNRDAGVLRELARQIREISAHPVQEERRQLWYSINRLERCRIPVKFHVEEFCWLEVLPENVLQCIDDKARAYEKNARRPCSNRPKSGEGFI